MRVTWWRYLLRLLLGCLALGVAGCQSSLMGDAWQTLQIAVSGPDQPTGAKLDPQFAYLRVTSGKNIAFIALGYVDAHPRGPVEVWYSAKQEVIRLQNGRLVGAVGLLTEWRQVQMPALPSWRELAQKAGPHSWTRTRDVMPGYRYNLIDRLQVTAVSPPAQSQLVGIAPASLRWFEESLVPDPETGRVAETLPPARYAVEFSGDTGRVVYAEQCLSVELCITWQRWRAGQ